MTDTTKEDLARSIKAILKDGDLDQLSAKKIRKMLEAEYKADFTERKEEIDKLVMQLITENESEAEEEEEKTTVKKKISNGTPQPAKGSSSPKKETPKNNKKEESNVTEDADADDDHDDADDDHDDGDDDDSDIGEIEDVVPKKKAKVQSSSKNKKSTKKVDDEELAKQLQDNESLRPSRRCKAQPVVRKQKKPRKEGAKGRSIYSRPCLLLPPLNNVLDTDRMPRPMIVKRLWEIVKERDLLDPKNKQFMLCDEQMQALFGRRRVRMFGAMKLLKPYIKDLSID